jgi:hypothetical protein
MKIRFFGERANTTEAGAKDFLGWKEGSKESNRGVGFSTGGG